MQLSKDSKLIDWSTRLAMYIFGKIKALSWHIVKHPLGSIFWVLKAYFALMFLSLFVACSFGAFAQTADTVPAQQKTLTKCSGYKDQHFTLPGSLTNSDCSKEAVKRFEGQRMADLNAGRACPSRITSRFATGFMVQDFNPFQGSCVHAGSEYAMSISSSVLGVTNSLTCPPDGKPEYTIGPDSNNLCKRPISDAKKCWPAGGDWEFAPQYFFTHGSSSMQSICALKDDTSGQRCPWKKVGTGVYVPDPLSTRDCTNDPNPPEPPAPKPDPAQCKTGGNGLKVCDSNPNEKCTANSTGALSCTAKCGYVNNNFFCFDNPNEPKNDPSMPDKDPLKPVDDLIADASKSINDMTKGDFKSILKGTDGRLDNLLTEMQNGNKTTEAQLGKLLEKEGTGDFTKAEGLLTSIDENINSINDALTKTGDSPTLEKPEFDEDTNNWKTRNFGTITKETTAEILELPLFKSVENFFNVSFGGSCPSYSVSVWVYEITIDQFCSPQVESLWPYIKAVVLLLASFLAIRIALL